MPQAFSSWAERGQFWGKVNVDKGTGELLGWLPLAQHCIDVAAVFYGLVSSRHIRQILELLAGRSLTLVHLQRLAVIVFFHDLGKLAMGFQSKVFAMPLAVRVKGHTEEALASLMASGSASSSRVLVALGSQMPADWFSSEEDPLRLFLAAWSHHGEPLVLPGPNEYQGTEMDETLWAPLKGLDPAAQASHLWAVARQQFPLAFTAGGGALSATAELQHYLCGLAMLADWLGSNSEVFPLTSGSDSDLERIHAADERVRRLLAGTRLDGLHQVAARFESEGLKHQDIFGRAPRPLQAAIERLDVGQAGVQTLVAESDTGSGKTEAALLWWAKLRAAGKVDGLYFALPTRVAARQLYERIVSFIASQYPDASARPTVLLAVPGYVKSTVADSVQALRDGTQHHDDHRIETVGRHWADAQAKRFLAAPIVVGTVDQALMSMLQTGHAHLRASLLTRHLLVVDEVHSSDTYMRALLTDVLEQRRRWGAYTLMLSATLGCEAREALLGTRHPHISFGQAQATGYPRLSGEGGFAVNIRQPGADGSPPSVAASKRVRVQPVRCLNDLEGAADRVAAAVRSGARVLVVLNTVKRACAMQALVESRLGENFEGLFRVAGVAAPHHGRFLAADRELMDAEVGRFLGESSGTSARVLIGTQTLEQSLNIDADVLFTDLCPMDVLLQRIGRLWRHDRAGRPQAWSANGEAQCFLFVPDFPLELAHDDLSAQRKLAAAGLGGVGHGKSVYNSAHILELTWRYFRQETELISIPRDNRRLVEYCVHSEQAALLQGDAWEQAEMRDTSTQFIKRANAQAVSARNVYSMHFGTRDCRFDTVLSPATREGEGTVLLNLDTTMRTPFGKDVVVVQVPQRDALKAAKERPLVDMLEVKAEAEQCSAGFEFGWCQGHWTYDRFGLRLA